MAANSSIEWTDHTFNPWIGCTKVSPGCAHCYAETLMDTRYGRVRWGKGQPRSRTSEANWKLPLRWNAACAATFNRNPRPRVFCASLADWLDDEVPIEWLVDLLNLIRATPNLDWQLLTKRPENWRERMMACLNFGHSPLAYDWFLRNEPPANVWIGTTVEDQTRADLRIPELLKIPARVRFLSCEPLLGSVDLAFGDPKWRTAESYHAEIHWVICGGESGPDARPMHPTWVNRIKTQCYGAGVPFLFKQWGEHSAEFRVGTEVVLSTLARNQSIAVGDGKTNHVLFTRVGKHAAGRLLNGVEHNAFPEVVV
jgi:protein gp37